jgi:hypothetical protein
MLYTLGVTKRDQQKELTMKDPQELMPGDWGMYTTSMDCSEPKADLDALGCKLVEAVRQGAEGIAKAVADIKECQVKHRKFGANDTEGRYALQDLMDSACEGTFISPEKLHDFINGRLKNG